MITSIRKLPTIFPSLSIRYNNRVNLVCSLPIDNTLIDQSYLDFGHTSDNCDPRKKPTYLEVIEKYHPFTNTHYLEDMGNKLRLHVTHTGSINDPVGWFHVPILNHNFQTPRIWEAQTYLKSLFTSDDRPYDDAYLKAFAALRAHHGTMESQELQLSSVGNVVTVDQACREAESLCGKRPQYLDSMLTDIFIRYFGPQKNTNMEVSKFTRLLDTGTITWKDLEGICHTKIQGVKTIDKLCIKTEEDEQRIEATLSDAADLHYLLGDVDKCENRRVCESTTGTLIMTILKYVGKDDSFSMKLKYSSENYYLYITQGEYQDCSELAIVSTDLMDVKNIPRKKKQFVAAICKSLLEYMSMSYHLPIQNIDYIQLYKENVTLFISVKFEDKLFKYVIPLLPLMSSLPLFHMPYVSILERDGM